MRASVHNRNHNNNNNERGQQEGRRGGRGRGEGLGPRGERLDAQAIVQGKARGYVRLRQRADGLSIDYRVRGLTPGLHGMHVHEFGDLTNGCVSAGGHFNPFGRSHGDIEDIERHLGDLGNIIAGRHGEAMGSLFVRSARLDGPLGFVGRTVIIHEGEDDLGRGLNAMSRINGNSGPPACCGIIAYTPRPLHTAMK